MSDVAQLGLVIDSSQVTQATAALTAFQSSAGSASTAAGKLMVAGADSGKSIQGLVGAAKPARDAVNGLGDATDKHAASLRSQRQVLNGAVFDLAMLGSQYGSVAASAAALYIENAHLFEGFGGLKSAIGSLITPTNLIAGGLIALAGAGALASVWLIQSEKKFDDVSASINTTMGNLHALQQAAAGQGIGQSDFFKGVEQFGAQIYQAQNNMGSLAEVMRANGQSAKSFDDYLEKAADLIKNAASDQQKLVLLQQMGLPATMDWVRLLSQGSEGIKEARQAAVDFDNTAESKLVASARKFDEQWAITWSNFSNNARSSLLTTIDKLRDVYDEVDKIAKKAGNSSFWDNFIPKGSKPEDFGLESITSADTAKGRIKNAFSDLSGYSNTSLQRALQGRVNQANGATIDPQVAQHNISLQQQALALLGSTTTAEEAARQVQLGANAARLQGVTVDQSRINILKDLAREQSNGVAQIKAQIDTENINTATIGMSASATAQYTAYQNALNKAKQEGRVLSADDIAQLKANAAALGQAAQNTDNLKFAFDNLVQGPMETFTSAIAQGKKAMDALKDAGTSALNAIAKKLADMAAQDLWKAAFGGASGGVLSMLGINIGGNADANPGSSSNPLPGLSPSDYGEGFAIGGYTGSGGTYDPAGIVHRGEFVFDQASVQRIGIGNLYKAMKGYADGGLVGGMMPAHANSNTPISVHTGDTNITIQGSADKETLAIMRQELARRDAELPARAIAAVKLAKQRNILR